MPEGIDLGLSGLASNFDWRSLVDQLTNVERAPQRLMQQEQQSIEDRKAAYASIANQLSALQNRVKTLNDPSLFDVRKAVTSNADLGPASAAAGAALGTYAFHIIQRATASVCQGSGSISGPLSATADVSGVVLGSASSTMALKGGT